MRKRRSSESCVSTEPNLFSTEAFSSPWNVRSNTRRILHLDFHFDPYRVQVVQELSDHDKTLRLQFCNEFQGLLLQNPNLFSN
jgi:hypothetical protein